MWTGVSTLRCLIRSVTDNSPRHWALEAAIAWKGYGTKVTGFDMVDTAKSIWPQAVKQGVADNIRFVRGNL